MLTKNLTITGTATTTDWLDAAAIFGTTEEADKLAICRLICPANLHGITTVTVETSYDGGTTVKTLTVAGASVGIPVAANYDIPLAPAEHSMVPPMIRLKPQAAPGTDNTVVFTLGFREV